MEDNSSITPAAWIPSLACPPVASLESTDVA